MTPLCTVKKELYVPSPEPHVGVSVSMGYIGRGLRREEHRAFIRSSDWHDTLRVRTSEDNGRTWSPWQLRYREAPTQGEYCQEGGESQEGTGPFDPVSGMLVKPVFQRIVRGDPREAMSVLWKGDRRFCDHGFYQLSSNDGRSWSRAYQLKYEEGPDFDPANWGEPSYFRTNEMYIGGVLVPGNGTVVISATVPVPRRDPEDEKVQPVFPSTYREGCVAGVRCFIGTWDRGRGRYDWKVSSPISLPLRVSTRGLVELDLSRLASGDLLLIMRGSNAGLDPNVCPGRKWMSVSKDGGLTWSPITDLRYDTGEPFWSPATFATTIRSSATGKLYCVLNINRIPPEGNSPRYPLQIAEVDERIPALKKDTVTVIDDRDPAKDSEHLQLTNFSLLEDREAHHLELYLTRLGERGSGPDTWTGDAWKYTLELR